MISRLLRKGCHFRKYPTTGSPIHPTPNQDMAKINQAYLNLLGKVRKGGDDKATKKLLERGKLPVRDRIDKMLDPGSPFLQLSPIAGHQLYGDEQVNSGGIVTGIGLVANRYCMFVANDPTVKG